jgi:DNA-binding PadR family transcriptional regulator
MPAQGNEKLVQGSKGLAQGDLRLVALALIADGPRRGYEIIKLIEEKTADWHSPAPSIVYPTLTNLAEAGYVTASTEPPRLYTITDDGRTYLKQNRDLADVVLDRLTALGERISRWRRALATISMPSSRIDGRLEPDADSAESLVEILARAAGDSQRK